MTEYINVVITNCAHYRGGGKGEKGTPHRMRKYQNHHTIVSKKDWETMSEKELLDRCHMNRYKNGSYVYIMSTSRMKKV